MPFIYRPAFLHFIVVCLPVVNVSETLTVLQHVGCLCVFVFIWHYLFSIAAAAAAANALSATSAEKAAAAAGPQAAIESLILNTAHKELSSVGSPINLRYREKPFPEKLYACFCFFLFVSACVCVCSLFVLFS